MRSLTGQHFDRFPGFLSPLPCPQMRLALNFLIFPGRFFEIIFEMVCRFSALKCHFFAAAVDYLPKNFCKKIFASEI
jgi:hypothetical protein